MANPVAIANVAVSLDQQSLNKATRQLQQKLSSVKGMDWNKLSQEAEKFASSLGKISTPLAGLTIGLAGTAIRSFLKSGSDDALKLKKSIEGVQGAWGNFGARFARQKIFGRDTYEWAEKLREFINGMDASKLSKLLEIAIALKAIQVGSSAFAGFAKMASMVPGESAIGAAVGSAKMASMASMVPGGSAIGAAVGSAAGVRAGSPATTNRLIDDWTAQQLGGRFGGRFGGLAIMPPPMPTSTPLNTPQLGGGFGAGLGGGFGGKFRAGFGGLTIMPPPIPTSTPLNTPSDTPSDTQISAASRRYADSLNEQAKKMSHINNLLTGLAKGLAKGLIVGAALTALGYAASKLAAYLSKAAGNRIFEKSISNLAKQQNALAEAYKKRVNVFNKTTIEEASKLGTKVSRGFDRGALPSGEILDIQAAESNKLRKNIEAKIKYNQSLIDRNKITASVTKEAVSDVNKRDLSPKDRVLALQIAEGEAAKAQAILENSIAEGEALNNSLDEVKQTQRQIADGYKQLWDARKQYLADVKRIQKEQNDIEKQKTKDISNHRTDMRTKADEERKAYKEKIDEIMKDTSHKTQSAVSSESLRFNMEQAIVAAYEEQAKRKADIFQLNKDTKSNVADIRKEAVTGEQAILEDFTAKSTELVEELHNLNKALTEAAEDNAAFHAYLDRIFDGATL